MNKILVTDLEYRKAEAVFENVTDFECICAPSEEKGLAEAVKTHKAKYVIVGVTKYTGELYSALPQGGLIVRFGVGHDGINKQLAANLGIYCANTPGVLDDSVAEYTIGLMLDVARHIPQASNDCSKGIWHPRVGIELHDKTLTVIGCGKIGSKVAKIAKYGFGMKVNGAGTRQIDNNDFIDEFTTDFGTAVGNADFVSVHIPDKPATRNFIDADKLRMMKKSAFLVNTSRGNVLDEDALYDAVKDGIIAGAALDVFKNEPYSPQSADKDLRSLDKILMSPHMGSSSADACERMARCALKNIRFAEKGRTDRMNLLYS